MTRSLTELSALFFDSDESTAGCRLLRDAHASWVLNAPKNTSELNEHIAQLHTDLDEIQAHAQSGLFIALSLSFEAYSAFSAAAHLPQVCKPHAISHHNTTPWLQAVAFKTAQSLTHTEALQWLRSHSENVAWHLETAHAHTTPKQFEQDVNDIRERIANGQTYQVNLTHPYSTTLRAFSPTHPDHALYACFAHCVQQANIAYGGVFLLPETSLLSFSPELFFELDEYNLRTRPMKGTAPIGSTDEETKQRAQALSNDPKNRAENLMIVDLMRNDVARLPQTTRVTVPDLFSVHAHGQVLQMTSTVQAQLSYQPSLWQLFDALFPCGSITGAPKHETLKIIQVIEDHARGAYCGAIGLIEQGASPDAYHARFNVAIRTLETRAAPTLDDLGMVHWHLQGSVGAGITYDSIASDEWDECVLKSLFFARHTSTFELIETMRLENNQGQWHIPKPLLTEHKKRMMRSAHTLKFVWDAAQFDRVIQKLCERTLSHNHEPYLRLRLSLNPSGQFTTQLSALESPSSPVYVKVFPEPTHSKNPMLQHKTSLRAQYNRALLQAHEQGLFDFIFLNEKAQLTEGSRSFIALNIDGSWYTPPLDCGVLPSVMRTLCMQDPQYNIQERILYAEDLLRAQEICLGNALYGLLPARLI